MISTEVREETEDRIVLADHVIGNVLFGLYMAVPGLVLLWFGIHVVCDSDVGLLGRIVMVFTILVGGILLFVGLDALLIKESVILDKRFQNVIIEHDSFIKYLKSVKNIHFSSVKNIEVTHVAERNPWRDYNSSDIGDSWTVDLITVYGDSIQIYSGNYDSKSEAEKVAEKICKMTDVGVLYRLAIVPISSSDMV